MNFYRTQIARLIPKAETGEQWAEICRLETLAVAQEKEIADIIARIPDDPEITQSITGVWCGCGAELRSEQEHRNEVCDRCL